MPTSEPRDDRRKRRGEGNPDDLPGFPMFPFSKDFEREFEAEFARMSEFVNSFMEQAMKNPPNPKPGEPFVFGFSMRMGPDGKPQFQEFGDTKPRASGTTLAPEFAGAREPLTDVLVGEREVTVTVELPGVAKEDVNLHVARDSLTIRVEAPRKYYKQVALPQPVVPKTAEATFKNGVLDVRVERETPQKESGHKVDIR